MKVFSKILLFFAFLSFLACEKLHGSPSYFEKITGFSFSQAKSIFSCKYSSSFDFLGFHAWAIPQDVVRKMEDGIGKMKDFPIQEKFEKGSLIQTWKTELDSEKDSSLLSKALLVVPFLEENSCIGKYDSTLIKEKIKKGLISGKFPFSYQYKELNGVYYSITFWILDFDEQIIYELNNST